MIVEKNDRNSIKIASEKLLAGEIVIIPTDTVYGFSGIVKPESNIDKKIREIKGREEEKPFIIKDVTQDAKSYSYEVDDNIWRLGRIKKQDEEPNVPMGEQCNCPYECWYMKYCERNKNK